MMVTVGVANTHLTTKQKIQKKELEQTNASDRYVNVRSETRFPEIRQSKWKLKVMEGLIYEIDR